MEVIILDKKRLEELKNNMRKGGYKNLHILSDFDRTLTYGSVDGKKTPSIISILRDGNHLVKGYAEKAHELFNKYHAIEVDESIPFEERKKAMLEWWSLHHKLLIESGLKKSDLEDIAKNGWIKFRDGVLEFLDWLHEKNIPLVVLSASGCGEVVQMFFKHANKDYPNIYYVTNKLNWDENGKAVSAVDPIIHALNKDEMVLKQVPEVYEVIKDRKNVILLGDSLHDIGMIEGFDYDNLINIGFLNFDYNGFKELYLEKFDIVLEGDGDFGEVNKLIKELE